MSNPGFIPPHGNYRELLSYQKAEVVYDVTFHFCTRFLSRFDRTVDQMVQAARSGKQNIVEGSKASGTSKETELKLTNVARASLEELLVDYQDFLRVRNMRLWTKDCKEARYVRTLGNRPHTTYETYREFCETRGPEVVANIALCLIHQTNYLLDQQLRRLEQDFLREGGLRERMTHARKAVRNQHRRDSSSSPIFAFRFSLFAFPLPSPMHPLLPRYVAGADCLHRAVHGLTHAELVAPPPAGPNMGTWSIKQVVVHMWHSDLAATHRMCRIASEDKPLLIAYDETAFANSLHYNELDTQTVCELFRLNRLHTASMLERLPASAFDRAGVHNHRGLITLGEMIKMYVDHVDGHMGFIARKRAAIGK